MSIDLDTPIDPDEIDTRGTDRDAIPAGWQPAHLIESNEAKTASGGIQHILTWEIIEGPHEKRRVWDRVNYKNGNEEARRLASVHYAKLADAVGVKPMNSLRQAEFKPVLIKIQVEKDQNGQYPYRNTVAVGGIKPYGTVASRPPARSTQTSQTDRASPAGQQARRPAATQQRRAADSDEVNPWDWGD